MLVTYTHYTPVHLRADRSSSSTQGAKKHLILQNQQGKFSSICWLPTYLLTYLLHGAESFL